MKQPSWEPYAGALVAWLLVHKEARPVDLWTITLVDGTVLRYSSADWACTVNGTTWTPGPGILRDKVRQNVGVSVDSMQLTIFDDGSTLVGGVPLLQAIARRVMDGATVALERAFFEDAADVTWVTGMGEVAHWVAGVTPATWSSAGPNCRGVVPVFYGRWGGARLTRSSARVEVRSHAELLDVMVPGDVYQPGCRNTVFDPQCTLSAAAFTVAGTTSAAGDITQRTVTSTSAAVIAKPTAWADLGVLAFTSGANAGLGRTVRTHVLAAGTATATVVSPFPYPIASGDAFTLRAGCDKRQTGDCTTKFANVVHFRGEPYIPAPESIT